MRAACSDSLSCSKIMLTLMTGSQPSRIICTRTGAAYGIAHFMRPGVVDSSTIFGSSRNFSSRSSG